VEDANQINEGLGEILRQSCRLMARNGYHGTSMRDIAQETGRSLSGLYHYFRSKEDLVYLINFHGFTTLNQTWRKMDGHFAGAREKLYAFVYCHTRYFSDHLDEMRVMTWGTQDLSVERAQAIQTLKDSYTGAAREVVEAVRLDSGGGELSGQRLSRETFILFGMLNWIFGWYSPTLYGRVEDLVGDIYRTFLHGLAGDGADGDEIERMSGDVREWFAANKTNGMW
jgi:AcrR family transcriptional regulator